MPSLLSTLQGEPSIDPTATLLAQLMQQSQGNSHQALMNVTQSRLQDPQNLLMRNAEHALFANVLMQRLGPFLGPLALAALVPGYTGAKALGQPLGLFQGASRPSWDEMVWGLAPLWGGIPRSRPGTPPPSQRGPVAQGARPQMSREELEAEEQAIQEDIEDLDELRDAGKMRQFNRDKQFLEYRIRAWQMRRQGQDPSAPPTGVPPGGAY